jgi:hypothetical protein
MLGHATASLTLDTYADLFDTDLDSVAVELDAAIKVAAAPAIPGSKLKAVACRLRAGTPEPRLVG